GQIEVHLGRIAKTLGDSGAEIVDHNHLLAAVL
ncbi:MAG: hypothetical protein RL605_386, partial [Actinomycetota bacterium]